ncbi:hypothetical protein TNIN_454881 [Trichonephila inaurata madagascariensis]|uniref:Uncharacterized protein n=1 Tax=Trichonephila inaurata madagascariensis TaxID=2747483 RepID=A0A8X7BMS7_9ARAC|nr:hypothetical protein TNIN_454881 [Trichonephila inaurata madagascariensis]
MLTTLRQSNAQDEDDPTFVEMLKQRTYYENLLDKAVSDFGFPSVQDKPPAALRAARFKTLKPQDTNAAGTSINHIPRNTTLQPKANNPTVKNLPPPIFLKITENHRKQMKTLNDAFPDLSSKLTGTQVNNNNYTNTVNSIVRPGFTYSQAAGTSNPKNNQQMAPLRKETPAALVTNQANQSSPLIPHHC